MKVATFESVEAEIEHYTKFQFSAFASDLANARTSPELRKAFMQAVSRNIDLIIQEMKLVAEGDRRKAAIVAELAV